MSSHTMRNWMRMVGLTPGCANPRKTEFAMVAEVRQRSGSLRNKTSSELRDQVEQLRLVANDPKSWPDTICESFALTNEALRRTHGIEAYDVQFIAAHTLAQGAIAQMATGEGKTFVQVLSAAAYALAQQGVHVMTTNAYLAERDFDQLAPVLDCLGVTAGLLRPQASPDEKIQAYQADVTFGPGYEFGFDYLRDQLQVQQQLPLARGQALRTALRGETRQPLLSMQRGHAVAIIDEIDSVLIDEATTPLILSGPAPAQPVGENSSADTNPSYRHASRVAERLTAGPDYVVDEPERKVQLTEQGMRRIQESSWLPNGMRLDRPWPIYVEQALYAKCLLQRDVDYIVDDDRIMLVDQFTGRVFEDRTLSNGLHQAVEALEGVTLTEQRIVLARISRQQYFQLYDRICGMTGTAEGSTKEFWAIYRLPVHAIPPRCPNRRKTLPTRFFADVAAKHAAIAADVQQRRKSGQPVLIGTPSIQESRRLARELDRLGVSYQLLNGVQDAEEAAVVAAAGLPGAVTIATNIAGRGTDIKISDGVRSAGGLHVIVTEPHRSSRIDRQLVGRCARQGDPGSCQAFVSADDELVRLHAPTLADRIRKSAHLDFAKSIARVQARLELAGFQRRRQMMLRSNWMEDIMARLAGKQPS